MKQLLPLFLMSCALLPGAVNAQTGSLDKTFGKNGIYGADLGGDLRDIAALPDGKIIGVGGNPKFTIARFLSNGSIDATFGDTGKTHTLFGAKCGANAVAVQADGKIVVAGYTSTTTANSGDFDIMAVRYNADGSLDTTFATNGIFTSGKSSNDTASAIDIQPDGKIILAGQVLVGQPALIRLLPDGTPDTTFNKTGYVSVSTPRYGELLAVKVLTDGTILGAGRYNDTPVIFKFNTDGSLVTTFGNGGMVTVPNVAGVSLIYNFVVLNNGDFIVAGGNMATSKYTSFLSKFSGNGTLVTTFGANGLVVQDGGGNIVTQAKDIAVSGNKIIVGYAYGPATNYDFEVSRYDLDGVPDTDFGTKGNVIFNLGSATQHDYLNAIAIQPDGKIIAGGYGASGDFSLARLFATDEDTAGTVGFTASQNKFNVYPNPVAANSKLLIDLNTSENLTLKLYDVKGVLITTVFEDKAFASGKTEVDLGLSNLANGIYFLNVMSANKQATTIKIVK